MNPIFSVRNARVVSALAFAAAAAMLCHAPDRSLAQQQQPGSSVVTTGITKPCKEVQLRFAAPGIVNDVSVKEGDPVNEKQTLAGQDSRQEMLAYNSMKAEADNDDKVTYSIADHDLKAVVAKRKRDLYSTHSVSISEVEQADLEEKLAAAQISLAKLEHVQKGFDAEKQKIKIELMTMVSPIKGIIEKINVGPGEIADPQSHDAAIVVGQWDPLWLEVHLPSSQAAMLKMDQTLQVKYESGEWQPARIIYFEKVDAASDTEMVRLELANPGNARLPGLHMEVRLN